MSLLLQHARVVDPSQRIDALLDVRLSEGRVAELGEALAPRAGERVVDCAGLVAAPAFVDPHVHFRQPGFERKETIATGSAAAAAGGYATVLCEPNTRPPCDRRERVDEFYALARRGACIRALTKACLTKDAQGAELSPILQDGRAEGVAAVSDDGSPVVSERVMRAACERAAELGLVVSPHSEDSPDALARVDSTDDAPAGLRGDFTDEPIWVARDLQCAADAGARIHLSHLSLEASLRLVRRAKAERPGAVTCEAAPHHLTLTSDDVERYGPNARMCPPLRSEADAAALRAALAEGLIDCVATDHAPHTKEDKAAGANGVIGLETAFAVLHTRLVLRGDLSLPQLIERMTIGPARAFGLDAGSLAPGAWADVVVLDLERVWTPTADELKSRSCNCPFLGWRLVGRPVLTIAGGRIVHDIMPRG